MAGCPFRSEGMEFDQGGAEADGRAVRDAQRRTVPSAGAVTGSSSAPICSRPSGWPARTRAPARANGAVAQGCACRNTPTERKHGVDGRPGAVRRAGRCAPAPRRCAGASSVDDLVATAPQPDGRAGPAQFEHADVGRRQPAGDLAQFVRRLHHALTPSARCGAAPPGAPPSRARPRLLERGHRLVPGRLDEADAAADRRLAEPPQIGLDHGADLRVAARGLRVAHLDDRLAAVRHLDHARARCRASASRSAPPARRAVPASR